MRRFKRMGRRLAAILLAFGLSSPALAEEAVAAPGCQEGRSLLPQLTADGDLARIEAEAKEEPNGTGRFWRIEKDGLPPSFLFGTMHLSDPRVLDLPQPVGTALDASRTVVIETLDVLDKGADMQVLAHPELLTLPAGKALDDYLTPAEKAELETLLDAHGTPYGSVHTLQPWFTAMGLMLPPCEAARAAGGARPLDVAIALKAKAEGKRLVGLESALDQLRVMASMPMELQTASLVQILKLADKVPDLFETMIEFYLQGRIAAIGPLSNIAGGMGDMPKTAQKAYEDFEKRIVVDRNRGMAKGLAAPLAEGGTFVAVGALHLPGKDGLVELLRGQGFRLTRSD